MLFEHYHLYQFAIWCASGLPRWLVYTIAALLAELNLLLDLRARRGVYANQRRVLPPDTSQWVRRQMVHSAFRNFAYATVDFFRIPQMNRANMDRFIVDMLGWEHLERALEAGKGGILATIHMGSWELGGVYLGLRGLPITAVALSHRDPRIDQIFLDNREGGGMEVVPVGGALRKLGDALARSRFIALAADRDVSGHGPRLPFFGEITRMPAGHAMLALRTGSWIFPTCVYRRPDGAMTIEIRPPIIPDPANDSMEGLTARCLTQLEEFIRARPEQWSAFYDLWSDADRPVI